LCEKNPELRASARSIRAIIIHHQGDQEGAKAIWEENLVTRRQINGETHHLVGQNLFNIGIAWGELGDFDKCFEYLKKGKEHREKYHPQTSGWLAMMNLDYGCYLLKFGDISNAEVMIQEAIRLYKASHGPETAAYAE
jgi:tetratricopeptide (TPR) repeat protein